LADLNPIEQVFAKLKALLRKAKERTIDIYGIASVNCWTNSPQRMRELSLSLGIRFNVIGNRSRAC
jgi:transposase